VDTLYIAPEGHGSRAGALHLAPRRNDTPNRRLTCYATEILVERILQ